jgi:hypothetical protein
VPRRWRDSTAFRVDPSAAASAGPTRRQTVVLLSVLVLVAAGAAAVSWLLKPSRAQAFDLIHGSVYIPDRAGAVSMDLASGKPTVLLLNAFKQVAAAPNRLQVQPLDGSTTLLLNRDTGEFNMIDSTGFVMKLDGGVPLPKSAPGTASTISQGVPAGQNAYIVRSGPDGTDVYLVSPRTIQTANGTSGPKPRAFRNISAELAPGPGALASANGDLWLLTGNGTGSTDRHALRRLSVPNGSDVGAMLLPGKARTVVGPSAIATTSASTDGNGGEVLAVASSTGITVIQPNGGAVTRTFATPLRGVDRFVPATNQQGSAAFLYHSASGWGIVSVEADGSGLSRPHLLAAIAGNTSLATPAQSGGKLYTMDDIGTTAHLYAITPGRAAVTTLRDYPLAVAVLDGQQSFDDAAVLARGSRVIFNSPGHYYGVTVFTDNTAPPLAFVKGAAVTVAANSGAEALTAAHAATTNPPTQSGPKPTTPARPVTVDPADNKLDCKKTTQVPHVPIVSFSDVGSRSVVVNWNYPIFVKDQDCIPSTYTVSFSTETPSSPDAPETGTVQGTTSVLVDKLYPNTRYKVVVTAYINGRHTSSPAMPVTTGPEGPAAPTGLKVTPSSGGDWNLSWHQCTGSSCVPAQSWDIIPQFCDQVGVSPPPSPINVANDPTLGTVTATFKGSTALLGRKLTFAIAGEGAQTKGAASSPSACIQSWQPPTASAITLSATTTSTTQFGTNGDAIVTLHFTGDPVVQSGGIGSSYTYRLTGAGTTKTVGPTTATTATFAGAVAPGATYQVTALVTPPGHPNAAITEGPVSLTTSSAWPAVTFANASITASGSDQSKGTLSFNLTNLSSANSAGEKFDFTSLGIVCGNASLQVTKPSAFDPGAGPITTSVSGIDPSEYNSTCSLSGTLEEAAGTTSTPAFYGGSTRVVPAGDVTMPSQSVSGLGNPNFSAAFESSVNGAGKSVLDVTISGVSPALLFFTSNWSEITTDGQTNNCGQDSSSSSTSIAVSQSCVQESGGTASAWNVVIRYTTILDGVVHRTTVPVNATPDPPSYQAPPPPCSVTNAAFSAKWTGTAASPAIEVSYDDSGQLAGCTSWTYTVTIPDPPDGDCTAADAVPGGVPDASRPDDIAITCTSGAVTDWSGWTVTVGFDDPSGNPHSRPVTVDPTPPP